MPLEDIDHIMRQIEALVPEGRANRQGMRIWREILNNIRLALENAIAGINAGNQAQATATAALNLANGNLAVINQNTANITLLRIDLTAHEAQGAGAGVLGHVSQGGSPPAAVVAAPGAAPGAYNAAHSQSIVDAHNELNARVNALIASLQGTGIIA